MTRTRVFLSAVALWFMSPLAAQPSLDAGLWEREPERSHSEFVLTGIEAIGAGTLDLQLRPLDVFAADAKLLIVDPDGSERPLEFPRSRYYHGSVVGEPAARVFLSLDEHGEVFGLVNRQSEMQLLLPQRGDQGELIGLRLERLDAARLDGNAEPFRCQQDRLPPVPAEAFVASSEPAPEYAGALPEGTLWRARVAIDTDFEFFQRFANAGAATSYVGNLIGYASSLYVAQLDTELQVSYLRLWNSSADPWVQTGSLCALYEFGKHWNDNMAAESRTIAHMLSGKSAGGGVAWLGVLCRGAFNTDATGASCSAGLTGSSNYGGAYGYTGNISGNFNAGNPTAVWDIVASAHEIGHNFNSPHTHCYANIGDNPAHVDQCYGTEGGSCYAGTASLPGPQGQGSGTIMSYCHLRPGGMSNVSLTLGQGHAFGVAPERVPARMRSHVQARATSNPQCLATGTLPAPSAPTTSAGSGITNTGFVANWSRPNGSSAFFLDVSTQSNFSSFVAGHQNLAVGAVNNRSVSGLSSGTTYYYRVRAANAGGTSPNSNVTTVLTTGGSPLIFANGFE